MVIYRYRFVISTLATHNQTYITNVRFKYKDATNLFLMPPSLQLWNEDLLSFVDDLLANHDYSQLLSQLDQATTSGALS